MPRALVFRSSHFALAAALSISSAACGGSDASARVSPDAGEDVAATSAPVPADTGVDADTGPGTVRPAACLGDAATLEDAAPPPPTACLMLGGAPFDAGADASGDVGAEASTDGSFADAADGADAADDAGDAIASEAGPSTDVYPAFPIDAPHLVNHGGPVLANPKLVTVSWPDDSDAPALEAFVDQLGQTRYWNAITCEYGVGPAASGACNHVHMLTAAPDTLLDSQADALVRNSLRDPAASGWPAPTPDTLYVLFISDATDFQMHTQQGLMSACSSGIGGYHTSTFLSDGTSITYAVVPRCPGFGAPVDVATNSASHEIAEASLDPTPTTNSGWRDFDDAHAVWNAFLVGQTENGDACEFYRDATFTSSEVGHDVQRQWSNASFAAGHAPCVPSTGTYFNVVPLDLVSVQFDAPNFGSGGGPVTTEGVDIPVGHTGSFRVGFYSDGPMANDWDLKVVEGNDFPGTAPGGGGGAAYAGGRLSISVDKTQGRNGTIATVTVRVNSLDTTLAANMVTLVSTDPLHKGVSHYWPVLITSN